jgi:hypothetical protein
MKRKTTDTPTRVFSYRCLPPITEQERVEEQYRLANQYRNVLVEIERRMRARFRDVVLACPDTRWPLLHAEDCEAAVDNAYDDLRAAKSGGGTPPNSVLQHLEACKELRHEAWAALAAAKRAHANDLRPGYEAARQQAHLEAKRARGDFSARGLRHGTYSRVEESVQRASKMAAPPKFQCYDGTGSIGTQLTGDAPVRGLTVAELYSCEDTRIRLGRPGEADKHPRAEVAGTTWADYWRLPKNVRRHAARTYVDLRVGSNPDRSPIFARFPVVYHRPLPNNAVIKWAYVVRRRIGRRFEWRLQFTIEDDTFRSPHIPVGEGVCAINLGWRNLLDDEKQVCGVRVGYLIDGDGHERELRVPEPTRMRWTKPFDLASIRAKEFDLAVDLLCGWIATNASIAPQWLREETRHARHWRAAKKLAAVIDRWKRERFDDDDAIFDRMMAWAKQDRHLLHWQEHQRDRTIAHRREQYRLLATELCRTYSTIVIGEMDLNDPRLSSRKPEEEGDPCEGRDQRRTARMAAPGELRETIRQIAHKYGTQIVEPPSFNITRACHVCGSIETWNRRAEIWHRCSKCRTAWDQDANACHNLLRMFAESSGEAQAKDGKVLAAENANDRSEMTGLNAERGTESASL